MLQVVNCLRREPFTTTSIQVALVPPIQITITIQVALVPNIQITITILVPIQTILITMESDQIPIKTINQSPGAKLSSNIC